MKKKMVVAIMLISVLVFGSCGNAREEVISDEVEVALGEVGEDAPKQTSTPVTVATTPSPTQTPASTPEPDDVEDQEVEEGISPKQEEIDWSSVSWTDLLSDEYWASLEETANPSGSASSGRSGSTGSATSGQSAGSSGSGSSSGTGTSNNGTGSSTGSSTSSQGTGSSGSGSSSSSGGSGNTGNSTSSTGSTGNTTPSAPATTEQPTQHTHNYVWVESGSTRVMTCSCGATTGRVEDKIADGVWGYWGDASALLTAVNNQRANGERYTVSDELGNIIGVVEGLPALDNSLSANAQSLAISAAQTNSYYGQGIHAGGSAQDAVSSWVGTGLMSNEKTTRGGVACLNKSNGDGTYTTIWVLVVG